MTVTLPDPFEGAKWGSPALGTPSGTITYSFAAQNLGNEPFHIDAALDPSYQADFRAALADWGAVANVNFQEVPDSAASDIRIGWEHIDGSYGTVAETYWNYQNGQMLHDWIGFDDSEAYQAGASGHTLGDGITFAAIAEHEIGHALGLGHNTTDPAIMNPVMSVNALQPADIAGIEAVYGSPQLAAQAMPHAEMASSAHAEPLIALPPLGDPSFAGALLTDIEELASERGVPLSQVVKQDLHSLLAGSHDADAALAHHLFAALPPELQHALEPQLGAHHHGDWLLSG